MAIETEPICWLHLPPDDDAPDAVKELWAKPLEKLGFVPNVLRAYAIRPRHLELWNAFYDELMRGESGLTKAQREMIAVVVSTANRCHYCIVSHSAALRKLTGDRCSSSSCRRTTAYARVDAKERVMLDFALKLTETSSVLHRGGRGSAARGRVDGRGDHGHRPGGGDVQLHEPARERPGLAPEPRIRRPRPLAAAVAPGEHLRRARGRTPVAAAETTKCVKPTST